MRATFHKTPARAFSATSQGICGQSSLYLLFMRTKYRGFGFCSHLVKDAKSVQKFTVPCNILILVSLAGTQSKVCTAAHRRGAATAVEALRQTSRSSWRSQRVRGGATAFLAIEINYE
eukprot:6184942-Pleurochrysis_carterae.AAC.1